MKRYAFSILMIVILTLAPFSSRAAYDQALTKNYLSAQTKTPWVILGLASFGENTENLDNLKNISSNSAIDYEAPVLALVATGKNPKTFPQTNYIEKIKSFFTSGQIGDSTSINDDIFGILALKAAGESLASVEITGAKNFILQNQNSDGGWGWSVSAGSDTDTTAASIVALTAAGLNSSNSSLTKALEYLKKNQNTDGGFAPDPTQDWGKTSSVSTTAWTVWALNSLNISPTSLQKSSGNPKTFLENSQQPDGSFDLNPTSFTPTVSAYVAIALNGKKLPFISPISLNSGKYVSFRIEGMDKTVCAGKVWALTALDVVKNSNEQCGFSYHLKETSYGPYLDKINSDEASGEQGWLYSVNYNSPDVGAADYTLKDNDDIVWYFSKFDAKLTRLNLSPLEIAANASAEALFEYLDNGVWKPVDSGQIVYGSQIKNTNEAGRSQISGPEGYYKVYGQKDGFVRSNSLLLKIGQPSGSGVNLSVNIAGVAGEQTPNPDEGSTINFSVEPGALDFGDLSAGQKTTKILKASNSGTVSLSVRAVVSGDNIFQDNIKLNSSNWQNFKTDIGSKDTLNIQTELKIPQNTPAGGKKTGKIIFWATPQ